jgi:enoyl-CoA hydratase
MAEEPAVIYHKERRTAVVTLNRPAVLNAINQAVRDGLVTAITAAEQDAGVRAIVVTGSGSRAFCAGADITEFSRPDSAVQARQARSGHQWIDALSEAAKPVIAAIGGVCFGGGLEIALACDIRIAAVSATFALPEVTLAIIPGAGGTQRLSRLIGLGPALRLAITGERIDATAALRLGLVSEVVPAGDLTDAAMTLADRISRFAPQAVMYAKEAVLKGHDLSLAAGLRLERDLSAILATTSDRLEAAAAFRERREPDFTGH